MERGSVVLAIDGNRMHGRLDLRDGTRYRVIEVERVRRASSDAAWVPSAGRGRRGV